MTNRRKYTSDEAAKEANRLNARERWHNMTKEQKQQPYILVKQELVKAARAKGCCKCGEMELCVLDFHHVDPKTKEYRVASIIRGRESLKRLRAELEKCIVVCANCHRKIHAGLLAA